MQSGGIDVSFSSVCFTDAYTGTVVGSQGSIYRTTDGGGIWKQQYFNGPRLLSVGFSDTENGYATGYEAIILHTTDGGKTWAEQFRNGFYYWFHTISVTDVNHATAVGQGGRVLRTTDAGANWTLQSENPGYNLYGVDFIDNNNGTAVGDHGTILHTVNGGTNWTTQESNSPESTLYSVSFLDLNNGLAVGSGTDSILILKTNDGGQNWEKISNSITETLYGVQFVTSQVAYTVGNIGIIYKSVDGGNNWVKQDSGRTSGLSSVSFINENIGTAVGEDGTILHTTNGGVTYTGIEASHSVSSGNILSQNYPNPFTETTTITWQLPKDSPVILKVYDFTGREVKTLVDGNQAKGEHKVKFDLPGLPAGVYFYRLRLNGKVETKKMVYLK
jgi:photosystem II stability/assembly factor-like uncharacterized protein